MRRSSRAILLLGILLAVGAFVLILFLGNRGGATATPTPAIAHIVVAAVDIPQGTTITQAMISSKDVSLSEAPVDAFTLPERVIGQTARQSVAKGAYVPQTAITGAQTTVDIASELKAGERAVALQLSDPTQAVGFLVQAGDRVDVIVSLQNLPVGFTFPLDGGKKIVPDVPLPNGNPPAQGPAGATGFQLIPQADINATSAKLLIQNARVVYTKVQASAVPTPAGAASPTPAAGGAPVGSNGPELVVLALTAQQAEVLGYIQTQIPAAAPAVTVDVFLAIRSPEDAQATPDVTTGVVLRTLLDTWGVLPPKLLIVQDKGE